MIIGRNPAHIIMRGWHYGQRLAGQVDAGEDLAGLGDAGQPFGEYLRVDMIEVKIDMVFVGPDTPTLAYFHRHRTGDDVA